MRGAEDIRPDWQPSYPVWATSVYLGAIGGTLAASFLAPRIVPGTSGWGLPTLLGLLESDSTPAPVLVFSLAFAFVLLSLLPGLMSLFLVALTDLPFRTHPIAGALFFGLGAGWVTQSLGGGVFGALFGAFSLGIIVLLLAGRRYLDRRARR